MSSPVPAAPRSVLCHSAPMHDAAYKGLFSHRQMVEDLLRGFAAREWSDKLDFETLEKFPADYVSDDLLQRHGDSVWRLRLQGPGEAWLYLLVMLEFQSTVDRHMAVRVLVYTGLLYQDLIRRGALDEAGRLPPVLPVVLYNGPERWTAPVEVGDLIAPAGEALAPFQPSQRYFLLDEGRWGKDDLPGRNLVSALVRLETSGTAEALLEVVEALSEWLRESGDDELRRAFAEWLRQMTSRRFGEGAPLAAEALEGGGAMLAERVQEWIEEWLRQGREQGLEQGIERGLEQGLEQGREQGIELGLERGLERGRAEERALLCRLASRRFGAETGERLSGLLGRLTDPERLAEVGDWVIECGTGAELLDRAGRLARFS